MGISDLAFENIMHVRAGGSIKVTYAHIEAAIQKMRGRAQEQDFIQVTQY